MKEKIKRLADICNDNSNYKGLIVYNEDEAAFQEFFSIFCLLYATTKKLGVKLDYKDNEIVFNFLHSGSTIRIIAREQFKNFSKTVYHHILNFTNSYKCELLEQMIVYQKDKELMISEYYEMERMDNFTVLYKEKGIEVVVGHYNKLSHAMDAYKDYLVDNNIPYNKSFYRYWTEKERTFIDYGSHTNFLIIDSNNYIHEEE